MPLHWQEADDALPPVSTSLAGSSLCLPRPARTWRQVATPHLALRWVGAPRTFGAWERGAGARVPAPPVPAPSRSVAALPRCHPPRCHSASCEAGRRRGRSPKATRTESEACEAGRGRRRREGVTPKALGRVAEGHEAPSGRRLQHIPQPTRVFVLQVESPPVFGHPPLFSPLSLLMVEASARVGPLGSLSLSLSLSASRSLPHPNPNAISTVLPDTTRSLGFHAFGELQLVSPARYTLSVYRAGEIDRFENLDIVHIRLLVGVLRHWPPPAPLGTRHALQAIQGHLAYRKPPPRGTLQ